MNADRADVLTRWIGRWILGVGVIHVGFGCIVFSEPLLGMLRDGIWNAVDGHPGRPLAFWFVFVGLLAIVFGLLVDWLEARNENPPPGVSWGFLAIVILGIVTMPMGAGWLLLPPAVGAAVRCRRVGPAQPTD